MRKRAKNSLRRTIAVDDEGFLGYIQTLILMDYGYDIKVKRYIDSILPD